MAFEDLPLYIVNEIKSQFAFSNLVRQFKLKKHNPKKYKEKNYRFLDRYFSFYSEIYYIKSSRLA